MPNVDYKITNKHKQDVPDAIKVGVRKSDGTGPHPVSSSPVDHKKKPKKSQAPGVPAGRSSVKVEFKETTGLMRKIEADVDAGSDITKLSVHLSPLGIGHKLRLEIKAWGSSGSWKSTTTYSIIEP